MGLDWCDDVERLHEECKARGVTASSPETSLGFKCKSKKLWYVLVFVRSREEAGNPPAETTN